MDLSIVIVNWRARDFLQKNLETLLTLPDWQKIKGEIFVVDNDSQDGSVEMVRERFPQVKLLANKENLGFARANNQAFAQAKGRYFLLLNPDMEVQSGILEKMVAWLDNHPKAAVVGALLKDGQGKIVKQARNFPTVWNQAAIILKIPHLFPAVLNKYLMVDFDYSQAAKVPTLRGSFFWVRKEVYRELGGLDERYFVWFEEVDFCRQVWEKGKEIWYLPWFGAQDYVGQSFCQLPRGKSQRYFRDSMLKYFAKWEPKWQARLLSLLWPIGIFLAVAGGKMKKQVLNIWINH